MRLAIAGCAARHLRRGTRFAHVGGNTSRIAITAIGRDLPTPVLDVREGVTIDFDPAGVIRRNRTALFEVVVEVVLARPPRRRCAHWHLGPG